MAGRDQERLRGAIVVAAGVEMTGGVSGEVRTEPGKDRAVATVPAVAYVGRQRIVHEGAYEMVRKAQPKSRAASVLS